MSPISYHVCESIVDIQFDKNLMETVDDEEHAEDCEAEKLDTASESFESNVRRGVSSRKM